MIARKHRSTQLLLHTMTHSVRSWMEALERRLLMSATPIISFLETNANGIAGIPLNATVQVSGGVTPTGTVTFNLYNNPGAAGSPIFTDTETLAAGTVTSASFIPAEPGTDYWVATYSGDGNNFSVSSGASAQPVTVTAGLIGPAGLASQDIGSPLLAGGTSYSGNTYTVAGSGADIWNTSDQFQFANVIAIGNMSVIARVTSQSDTSPWAKAGVMFRASASAGSAWVSVVQTPGNGVDLQWRDNSGKLGWIQGPVIANPAWVKLVRNGNSLVGYVSSDGINFTQVGSVNVVLPNSALAGLAVSSHDAEVLGTATFDNVAINALPQAATTTVPNGPYGLSANATTSSEIDLNWSDNSNNETGIDVERAINGGGFATVATLPAGSTSYADAGLSGSYTFTYQIQAFNSLGSSSSSSSATATTAPLPTSVLNYASANASIPNGPYALWASAASSTEVDLNWATNSNNETGFDVERATNGGDFATVATLLAGSTSYRDLGVSASFAYTYRIQAFNLLGGSSYSNSTYVTAQPPATPPNAPFNLVATAVSNSEIDLTWISNSNNESGFVVYHESAGGDWTVAATLPPATTSFADTGLSSGTFYEYEIYAFNSAGPSYITPISIATTLGSPAPILKPSVIPNLVTSVVPGGTIDASTFFPIGVYDQPTYNFSTWTSRGINTLVGYEGLTGTVNMADWSTAAQEAGLHYIRQASLNPNLDVSDPWLLAWLNPIDEPDQHETTQGSATAETQAFYDQLHGIDPKIPVLTNVSGGYLLGLQSGHPASYYQNLFQSADWVSADIYPVTGWNNLNVVPLTDVGLTLDALAADAPGKRKMAFIEAGNQNLSVVGPTETSVTPQQFDVEIWDAIVHGADAITYFPISLSPFSFDDINPAIAAEMTRQNAILSALGGVILSTENPSTMSVTTNSPIETTWRQYNGHTYIIAVNTSTNTINATLNTAGLSSGSSLSVYNEGRSVTMQGSSIADTFAPDQIHIYEL